MSTDANLQPTDRPPSTRTRPGPKPDLLQQILAESRQDILKASRILETGAAPEQKGYQLDIVGQLVEEVMKGAMTVSADTEAMLNARIAEIDALLSDQLNAIMHNPEFQKLEASWRGLHYLVDKSETGTMLQIRVIHATKKELLRDMEKAKEFDQSTLFKKIYTDEYDVFGGYPYGALIGDYEFGKHPQDISLLKRISQVAAAAHAPFLSAAAPGLFGFETFERAARRPRPGRDLPDPRLRQVEGVPRERRLAIRRPLPAAHPDAAALWPRHRARRVVQLRGRRRRPRLVEVSLGQRRLRPGHQVDRRLRHVRLVRLDPRGRERRPGPGPAAPLVPQRPWARSPTSARPR